MTKVIDSIKTAFDSGTIFLLLQSELHVQCIYIIMLDVFPDPKGFGLGMNHQNLLINNY